MPHPHPTRGIPPNHGALLQSHHAGGPIARGRDVGALATAPVYAAKLPPLLCTIPRSDGQHPTIRRQLELPSVSPCTRKGWIIHHRGIYPAPGEHFSPVHPDPQCLQRLPKLPGNPVDSQPPRLVGSPPTPPTPASPSYRSSTRRSRGGPQRQCRSAANPSTSTPVATPGDDMGLSSGHGNHQQHQCRSNELCSLPSLPFLSPFHVFSCLINLGVPVPTRQNANPKWSVSCCMTAFFYSRKGAFWPHSVKVFHFGAPRLMEVHSE